jgi:acyl-CoA synthetase (AMP-forming)/AMP-acid ligase II
MLSHENLSSNTRGIVEYLALTPHDRTVCVLPFYYSYGNSLLHTHLYAGASLILVNSLMYPVKVLEAIQEHAATGFSGVPSTFGLLLARTRLEDHDLSCLRYLTQAGGAMPPAAIDRILQAVPGARFFAMYGQTEATARLSYLPPEMLSSKRGSVGIPVPGVELRIRDAGGNELPPGQVGEVWARGPNVMLGYWKAESLTREVLVDGWLRTGDLGYRDEDGYLYLQGRSGDMIKTGAHRVSPGEIEEVIAELEGIAEVGVVGVDDELMGQVIRAVVVARAGADIDARTVQRHCHRNLPQYKIPKEVLFADALPRTASGKIRRFALAEIDGAQ